MPARWGSIGASVRGASHVREGSPNQDALLVAEQSGACMALVADGHGGARHFRSAAGARLAVEAAADVLQQLMPVFGGSEAAAWARLAATELPARIVEAWRERVHRDLAQTPFEPAEFDALHTAEGVAAVAAVQADPLLAYGATLLAAVASDDALVIAQLGDGDVLLVDAQGRTQRPLPADERLTGHLTTSICRAEAASDFRTAVVSAGAADTALLVLATDGYANSFRSDADFVKIGGDFLDLLRRHGPDAVQQQLPDILAHASTHGSGDDITVAMLLAPRAQAADSVEPDSAGPSRRAGDPAASPQVPAPAHGRKVRARGWIGVLAVVVLALLLWAGQDRLPGTLPARDPPAAGAPGAVEIAPGPAAPKDAEAVPDAGARPASQPNHPASSPAPAT